MIELNMKKSNSMVQEIDKMYEEVQEEYFFKVMPLYDLKGKVYKTSVEKNISRRELLLKYTKYLEDSLSDSLKDAKLIESALVDIYYRLSLIYSIKGMLCVTVGVDITKIPYFDKALGFLNKAYENILLYFKNYRNYINKLYYSYALAYFCKKDFCNTCLNLDNIDFSKYNNRFICNILAGLPLEILFFNRSSTYPAVVKNQISANSKQKIKHIISESNSDFVLKLLETNEPIGYSDFLNALSVLYVFYVHNKNNMQWEMFINDLKSIIIDYIHFTPARSNEVTTNEEKLNAFFDRCAYKIMQPALKRNVYARNRINLTCSALFRDKMINSIRQYSDRVLSKQYEEEDNESEIDYALREGFDIDEDGNWVPSEEDD